METKTRVIDGNNFSDETGFYNEAARVLTKGLQPSPAYNLNAFNDLLRGGFGVHQYEELISLKWINVAKSRKELSATFADAVKDLILSHEHIEFLEG